MILIPRWSDRNLTRLELTAALLILALLIGIFSKRILVTFARAESTLVNATIANINTSIQYYAIDAALKNNVEKLTGLSSLDPMKTVSSNYEQTGTEIISNKDLIDRQYHNWIPVNYLGQKESPDMDSIPKGYWYFDITDKMLVYRVNNAEYFHSSLDGVPRIRLEVVIDYDDIDEDGAYDPAFDSFRSVKLESPDYFEWTFER